MYELQLGSTNGFFFNSFISCFTYIFTVLTFKVILKSFAQWKTKRRKTTGPQWKQGERERQERGRLQWLTALTTNFLQYRFRYIFQDRNTVDKSDNSFDVSAEKFSKLDPRAMWSASTSVHNWVKPVSSCMVLSYWRLKKEIIVFINHLRTRRLCKIKIYVALNITEFRGTKPNKRPPAPKKTRSRQWSRQLGLVCKYVQQIPRIITKCPISITSQTKNVIHLCLDLNRSTFRYISKEFSKDVNTVEHILLMH